MGIRKYLVPTQKDKKKDFAGSTTKSATKSETEKEKEEDTDTATVGSTVKWIAEFPNLKEYKYELYGLGSYLKTRETGKIKFTFYKPTVLKNVIISNTIYDKSKFEELIEYLKNHGNENGIVEENCMENSISDNQDDSIDIVPLELGTFIIGAAVVGGGGAVVGSVFLVRPKIKKKKYFNKQISKAKLEVENFMQNMRSFIHTKLEEYYGDEWWDKGIPEHIRISVENKIRKKEIKQPKLKFQYKDFLDFNDFFLIITEKENWGNIFSDIFTEKESLGENLENLRGFKTNLEQKVVTSEELNRYPLFIFGITNCFSKGFNVFLSYSTRDTDHFNIKEISSRLEAYPKVDNVLFWEADSGEDIVKYMERALKISRVFVLFCSENSLKSKAVEDEWESAFQLRKEKLMKIVPVYEDNKHIPYLLKPLLNVKFTKEDFDGFIENLYKEIIR